MPAEKAVVLLSGGIDSTTLLFFAVEAGYEPLPLVCDYGQRHRREVEAAAHVAERAGCALIRLSLPALGETLSGSALTDPSVGVPRARYDDRSMRITVVPNRNMILLAVAAAVAINRDARAVAYAAHAGDHAIYADCRPEFVAAMRGALAVSHDSPVQLFTPFLEWDKAGIVRWGADHGVPFGLTWSCYEGGEVHCGRCGTCIERREAFALAGVSDPTAYESDPSSHEPGGPAHGPDPASREPGGPPHRVR